MAAKLFVSTEHDEQALFVSWFRGRWPGVTIFAIPNGGARHPATAKKLKAEGVLPGVPDLFVPAWKLWIEMKRNKGGVLSKSQKEFIGYLESCGYACIVGKGSADAIKKIIDYEALNGCKPK